MSLLNNRALISHLVVTELLHDVQLVASAEAPNMASSAAHMSLPLSNDIYESIMESSRTLSRAALKRVSMF